MKNFDFSKAWNAFLHWKGWRAFAAFCKNGWSKFSGWQGWRKLFALPFPVLLALSVVSFTGLAWVFVRGLETQIPAYFLYALCAYCLVAVCAGLPGALRRTSVWISAHPAFASLLKNKELHFKLELYFEQFINFAYGIFKIISGVIYGSAWIGCDGIYNMAQALIQLFQILRRKNAGSLEKQWKSYRFCGVLILLMHLTLTGIVFQMVNWNRAEEQGQIMVIATAAFAFYKIINSFIDIARDRKHTQPVDSSIRMLELSQAIFAMFSLQASMFHTFGTGEAWEHWMNLGTGCVVCLLVASMGVYMIRRGNRELRTLQEGNHGQ